MTDSTAKLDFGGKEIELNVRQGSIGPEVIDIGKLYAQGVLLPQFVGTAADVADQIEESFTGGEADGFIVSSAQTPGTFNDFVDYVVPELQRRGLFRTEYEGTTLREHLGLGSAEEDLPADVRGVSVRLAG